MALARCSRSEARLLAALVLGLAGLVGATPCTEGQEVTARARLAAVLRRAKESGALERLTAPRWFETRARLTPQGAEAEELDQGILLSTRSELDVAAGTFTFRLDAITRRQGLELVKEYTLGLADGAARAGRVESTRDRTSFAEPERWTESKLPDPVVLFVLTRLFDQGLPEVLDYEATLNGHASTASRLKRDPDLSSAEAVVFHVRPVNGADFILRPVSATTIRIAAAPAARLGELLEISSAPDDGRVVSVLPLSKEEHETRRLAWKREQELRSRFRPSVTPR